MIVKDKMIKNPKTVVKSTPISRAVEIMQEGNFHRLPVVENGRIVGLLTESTISKHMPGQATSLSIYEINYLLSKMTAEDVMIKQVITISPCALLEKAALVMRKNNIGCLPVVEKDKLVGIITSNDILDAFVDILGYFENGSRIEIEVSDDEKGVLAEIARCYAETGANISRVNVFKSEGRITVMVKASGASAKTLKAALETASFHVTNAIDTE